MNAIVEIVAKKYQISQDHVCKFKSMQSFKSVTSCVQAGTTGPVTLVDTPGFNDPDATKTDKNIHIETTRNLSLQLYDEN